MKKLRRTVTALFRPVLSSLHIGGCIPIAADGFWRYRSGPGRSLRKAAGLFNEIRGETIIEVGSGLHGRLAGNSMLVWPKQTCARRIIAIDLDQDRINEVKAATASLNVELVVGDGIAYLDKFTSQIDLLYLDFWTSDPVGTIRGGTSRAEAYLKAYEAAKGKMSPHSLILMDDTDHVHPWKHTHVIPRARLDGYEVVYTGRQTLLRR
jgi:Methyltransferase domain